MQTYISRADSVLIPLVRKISPFIARLSFFVVYSWFGYLKVIDVSSANDLVRALLAKTMPFWDSASFIPLFGWFEVLIGVLFLFPKLDRITIFVMLCHMFMTFGPLVLLPDISWASPGVPTLEGQYIIKNLVLVSLALMLAANMRPVSPLTGATVDKR